MKHQLKTLPTSKSSNPKRAQPFEAERRSLRAAANKRPIPSPLEDTGGQLAGGRGVLSPVSYCNLPESRTCPSCLPPSARQQQVSSSLQSLPITQTVSQELLFTDSECYESASLPATCQCSSRAPMHASCRSHTRCQGKAEVCAVLNDDETASRDQSLPRHKRD